MSSRTTKILKLFTIGLIPILIIITTVRLLATDQYLAFEYGKDSFPPDSFGFTQQQRFDLASSNIHYVRAHLPDNALSNQVLNGAAVYSSREASHMADVRAVFQAIFQVWQVTVVLFLLTGSILWQKRELQTLGSAIQWGGLLTSSIVLFIGLSAIFAWQSWFGTFHLFFFEPGSWLFSYSDTLIRLFPVEFWFDATMAISILSLAGGFLLALIGWQGKRVLLEKQA